MELVCAKFLELVTDIKMNGGEGSILECRGFKHEPRI